MKRAVFVVGAAMLAACGGGSGESAESSTAGERTGDFATGKLNSDPVTVVSDDGMLILEIPSGAMPAGTEVAANIVVEFEHSDVPPEAVLGAVYSLEPSGVVFDVPINVELVLAEDPGNAAVTTVVLNGNDIDIARGQTLVENDRGELVHQFSMLHFSDVVTLKAIAITATVTPTEIALGPDESVDVEAGWALDFEQASQSVRDAEVELSRLTRVRWSHPKDALAVDVTRNVDDDETGGSTATIRCLKTGRWQVTAVVHSGRPASGGGGLDLWEVNPKPTSFSSEWLYGFVLGDWGDEAYFADFMGYIASGGLSAKAQPVTVTCSGIPDPPPAGEDSDETEGSNSDAEEADADERPEPPDDINPPVEIEMTHEGPCGWPPPRPPDGALLMTNFRRLNDTAYRRGEGYALVLGTPHGAFVQFDDGGTLIADIEPRGEPPWPEWANVEVTYTDTAITIVADETRWDENGPCTQRVTYVYRIGNTGKILDYMDGIPSDGIPDVEFDGVTADYDDGTFSMGGKLTFEDGVVVDLRLECSGLSLIEYRLIPIEVAADGTFLIEEEFSDCVVINLAVAANGNQITRSSVSN